MRVTFVIDSMAAGGAQRVIADLAAQWVAKGWQVAILTLNGSVRPSFYPLDERIEQRHVNADTTRCRPDETLRVLFRLRRAVLSGKPDAVVSFLDPANILVLLVSRLSGVPVIVSERASPVWAPMSPRLEFLKRRLYPRASAIVFQTRDVRRYYLRRYNLRSERSCVIPNPARPSRPLGAAPRLPRPSVAAMGRLVFQKGFDLLLDAFARIAPDFPEWCLTIAGEGDDRAALEAQCRERGLTDRVRLPGLTVDADGLLAQADVFVLSSRYEGFPNVLVEAMAAGCAAVAFDCDYGPRDILRHGVDGILVPPGDVGALAAALASLMSDQELRTALGNHAMGVTERLSRERIAGQWETLLRKLAGNPEG